MGNYQEKQFKLVKDIEERFKNGENPATIVDPVKDYATDKRLCFTSVAFLPEAIQNKILSLVVEHLKLADPNQYFYLPSSLHVTIQNVRVISSPPTFSDEDIEKVRHSFKKIVQRHKKVDFEIKNLFELPTNLALSAFSDESLPNLILDLRKGLKRINLPDDKGYAGDIVFGNITICRYVSKPNVAFLKTLAKLKAIEIGKFTADKVSLITTNSVCHPKMTKIIEVFNLN